MSDSPSRLRAFLSELKRRRVFRVAIVYAIVGLAVLEARPTNTSGFGRLNHRWQVEP